MPNVFAVKSGNWSDTTLWNTGSLPTIVDDVFANNFTVYVDISPQVLSVRNLSATSITRGGSFILNSGISLSANVIGGGVDNVFCVRFLSAAPAFATLVGSVSTNGALVNVQNAFALELSSTGTLTVIGSALGGVNNNSGTGVSNGYIQVNAPGILNIFGDVQGSLFGNVYYGVNNTAAGTVNIVGNILGRPVANSGVSLFIINNASTGTINVTGSVFAGAGHTNHGINNASTGRVNVIGNIRSGSGTNAHGILNNSSGTVTIIGNVVTGGGFGVANASTGTVNLTGNVTGVAGTGVPNTGSGTVNILGDLIAIASSAATNSSTGNINVVGTLRGGTSIAAAGITNTGSGTLTFVGSVTGGSATNAHGISQSLGIVNLTGTVIGGFGAGDAAGLTSNSSNAATVTNIFGNVFGGTGGLGAYMFGSSGTINVYGNVFGTTNRGMQVGGSAPSGSVNIFGSVFAINSQGVLNTSTTGVVTITGDVFGGNVTNAYGVQNGLATSVTIVSGRAVGGIGSAAYGAFNASTGILRVKRAVGNEWGLGYTRAVASVPGVFSNVQGSQTFVEELELGPRGQWPTGGVIFFTPNTKATSMFETDTFQPYNLIQSNSADNLLPPVSSVRQGTTYNLGLSTGTCIIPPGSSVAAGALVDNLTGTAVLTPQTTWNYPTTASDINSMGGRLRNALNASLAEKLINSFSP